jgi:hypothetical protein
MFTLHEKKPKSAPVFIEVEYEGTLYKGVGIPLSLSCREGQCFELDITLNNLHLGVIHCSKEGWDMYKVQDKDFVDAIGKGIFFSNGLSEIHHRKAS